MSQNRSKARERKAERERQRRRNRQLTVVGAIVVVVLAVAGLFLVSNQPAEAPIPEEQFARYDNLRRSFDANGFAVLGNPEAPVRVAEFSSFSCPACLDFHDAVFSQLIPRIERGEISFTYVPLQNAGNNAGGAARAALCAGEQGLFWEMHDTLFEWQEIYAGSAFSDNRLRTGAAALGLDMDAFSSCVTSERTDTTLGNAQAQGVNATPTIQVNGSTVPASLEAVNAAIDNFGPFSGLEPGTLPQDAPEADDDAPAEEEPVDDDAATTEVENTDETTAADDEATETEADTPSSDDGDAEEAESDAEATEASE